MSKKPLDRAVSHFKGGRAELADRLGVSVMAISHWFNRGLPASRAIDIERATGGAVTRQDLRPDFFGEPADESA